MDPRIKELKTTTFSGRRLSRRQISEIQETVALLPGNSRGELCKTICEHLGWKSAKGSYKVGACMGMLEHLEKHGVLKLPPKRESMVRTGGGKPVWTSASDPQPEISAPLSELGPVRLEVVSDTEGRQLWNALVDRHHYLGYKRPFGEHIRYFLLDSAGRRLGCMLFESSTRSLPRRDRWIGWSDRVRNRRRHLVAVNSRFLVLPWVSVKNLASHALGLARRRLADDWEAAHGCRPALCETFVDEGRFRASCYRAANWLRIGETSGGKGKSRKGVYVLPLSENCREILRGDRPEEKAARPKTAAEKGRSARADRRFCSRWQSIVDAAVAVAAREDGEWRRRRRVIDSLLIILFVFRLVAAGRSQGYRATLCELWDQCRRTGIPLPQEEPPAASSICEARDKLDEAAFKRLHREVLACAPAGTPWKGRRIFAVDGSKINLPRPLADLGYRPPCEGAHYPQGLVSCLYDTGARIPVDFDLFRHGNERVAARTHLEHAAEGDIVVYDRGYYSWQMLLAHLDRGLNCVFRLQRNAAAAFDAFIDSSETDATIELDPPRDSPQTGSRRVRLIKYVAADTEFRLATTLLDERKYPVPALADLYRGRWEIEEFYGGAKELIGEFRGRTERGVKQELYAAFTLIAVSRLFANRCDSDANRGGGGETDIRANFKNGLRLLGREIEAMFLAHGAFVAESVARIMTGLSRCLQRERPGRSYPRASKKPRSKWMRRKAA